jgi:branched-chain amino acid aminotransferase
LDGVTRRRVISLLRGAGIEVIEKPLTYSDFESADEIFSTGNYAKVSPIIGIDNRVLQPGPMFRRARALYWEYAHNTARP